MKKYLSTLALAVLALGFSSLQAADIYTVDEGKSVLKWHAEKVTGEHYGTVNIKSGHLELDGKNIKSGTFIIDMPTIKVDDLEDKEWNAKLTGHLNSDDFFNTTKHKVAALDITEVKALGGNEYMLSGDLTIKGIKKPISFPATLDITDKTVKGKGTLKIDRTDYDIKYRSGSYFEDLGDKMIYDEFEIDVDIVAKK